MKILVSSCLLGEKTRYDAKDNKIVSPFFEDILKTNDIYSFCPEQEGGLSTPRAPAEITNGKVFTNEGLNVTQAFQIGATKTLELCKRENIKIVLLKAKSPSCGNIQIYDGTFKKILIDGFGISAKLLKENNILVFNEDELEELTKYLVKKF